MRKIAIFMLFLLLTVHAEDYVAINSMDGRDVLSGIYYANVKEVPVKFMPVPGGDSGLFATKVGFNHDILLIEGDVPVSTFVGGALEANNNTVEIYTSTDAAATNLELAERSGAGNFIIVDSAFSDSALSVLPYAAKTNSYVILADSNNIGEVKEIVQDSERLIIYGLVEAEVRNELAEFSPETIGKGEDKFEDNIEIVEKTMEEFPSNSVTIVDGTFIEEGMAKGEQPFLLTGSIVPQSTYDFVKEKVSTGELQSAMLIGNELVVPVYDMRASIEQEFKVQGLNKTFGIIVKFAQVVPQAGNGAIVLDTFPLPAYKPELEIREVFYNDQTESVMVSVDNIGEGPAYFTQEVRIQVDGTDYEVFGSEEPQIIERGEQIGREYDLDLSDVPEGSVDAVVVVKYGSSKNSLEEFTSLAGPLTTISFVDSSNVSVQSAKYDKEEGSVMVTIKNNGDVTAYVFSKLSLKVNGEPTTISSAGVRSIEADSLLVEEFPLELSDEDLAANRNASVFVDYGAREGFLLKRVQYILPLEGPEGLPLWLLLLLLAVLLLLAAIAYRFSKKEKTKPAKKKR